MDEALIRALSDLIAFLATVEINDANLPYLAAIALLSVFLIAGRMKYIGAFFTKILLHRDDGADRMFEKRNISALKACPGCAEQLPLSTLICHACDYNFLSGSIGHGHKLLPAPQSAVNETPARQYA